MDSTDSGPPPKKRFRNGNEGYRERFSESDSRGGRPSRGFRGRGFSRGGGGSFRGGFRGSSKENSGADFSTGYPGRGSTPFHGRGTSFRGRDESKSLSSPDDHAPGIRGGRGSFRARGRSSGFRGRGGSLGFRGRGFAPRIRGAPIFPERKGDSFKSKKSSFKTPFAVEILNLDIPRSDSVDESRGFVRGVLSNFKCFQITVIPNSHDSRVICYLESEDAVKRACKDLNGRFIKDRQILVIRAGKQNQEITPILIQNLPESASLSDLVEVLQDCKTISRIGPLPSKSALGYMFVFVCGEDDVKRLMDKSSTEIKGRKIVTKCLDPSLVLRTVDSVLVNKWQEIFGSDIAYYINKPWKRTDIYFESSADLETALKKVEEFNKGQGDKIDLQRLFASRFFFAEICGVEGDVNDVELYSLLRKHGKILNFKRLDKNNFLIVQDPSAAKAAMSLSNSTGCGGTLRFFWNQPELFPNNKNYRIKEIDSKNLNTEKTGDHSKGSIGDEEIDEDEFDEESDNDEGDDPDEEDDNAEEEEDDEQEEEDDEQVEEDEQEEEDDDEEEDDEEEDDDEGELEDDNNVGVNEESEEEVEIPITKKKSNKNKNLIRQAPQSSSNTKQNQRTKKRKISSSA